MIVGPTIKQLADDYAGRPAVFLEDRADSADRIDAFHYGAWWAAYGSGTASLPMMLVGSGNQCTSGMLTYPLYQAMVDTEIARSPGAEVHGS